jgi:hypothetical protein
MFGDRDDGSHLWLSGGDGVKKVVPIAFHPTPTALTPAQAREEEQELAIQRAKRSRELAEERQAEKKAVATEERNEARAAAVARQKEEEEERLAQANATREQIKQKQLDIKAEAENIRKAADKANQSRIRIDQLEATEKRRALTDAEQSTLTRERTTKKEQEAIVRASNQKLYEHTDELSQHTTTIHSLHQDAIEQKLARGDPIVDRFGNTERTLSNDSYQKANQKISAIRQKADKIASGEYTNVGVGGIAKDIKGVTDEYGRAIGKSAALATAPVKDYTGPIAAPSDADWQSWRKNDLTSSTSRMNRAAATKEESIRLHDQLRAEKNELTDTTKVYGQKRDAAANARKAEKDALTDLRNDPNNTSLQKTYTDARSARASAEKEASIERTRVTNSTKRIETLTSSIEKNAATQYDNARAQQLQRASYGIPVSSEDRRMLEQANSVARDEREQIRHVTQQTRETLAGQGRYEQEESAAHQEAIMLREKQTKLAQEKTANAAEVARLEGPLESIEGESIEQRASVLKSNSPLKEATIEQRAASERVTELQTQLDNETNSDRKLKLQRDLEQAKLESQHADVSLNRVQQSIDKLKTRNEVIDQESGELERRAGIAETKATTAQVNRERYQQYEGLADRENEIRNLRQKASDADLRATDDSFSDEDRAKATKEAQTLRDEASRLENAELEDDHLSDAGLANLHTQELETALGRHEDEVGVLHEMAQLPGESDDEFEERRTAWNAYQEAALMEQVAPEVTPPVLVATLPSVPGTKPPTSTEEKRPPTKPEEATRSEGAANVANTVSLPESAGFPGGGGGTVVEEGAGAMGGLGGLGLGATLPPTDEGSDNESEPDEGEEAEGEEAESEEPNDFAESLKASPAPLQEEEEEEEEAEEEPALAATPSAPSPALQPGAITAGPTPHPDTGLGPINNLNESPADVFGRVPIVGRLLRKEEVTREEEQAEAMREAIVDKRIATVRRGLYVYDERATQKYSSQLPRMQFQAEMLIHWTNGESNGNRLIRMISASDSLAKTVVKEARNNTGELYVLVTLRPNEFEPPFTINTNWLAFNYQEMRGVDRFVFQVENHTICTLARMLSRRRREEYKRDIDDEPKQLLIVTSRRKLGGVLPVAAPTASFFCSNQAPIAHPTHRPYIPFVHDFGDATYDATTNMTLWAGPGVRIRNDEGLLFLNELFHEPTHPGFYMYEYRDPASRCVWRWLFDEKTFRFAFIEYLIPLSRYMHF